ncbi:protein phosphatase 2C domain-containing protein [Ruminococcus sp.]|uniref:PP2C family protein-serine/threonine phosphatase n=1 Tax=Ruminococcus sp. TaxID=41978 RepID=UPI0025E0F3CA|nr:protein phosphatase 2C domain-containing protein [Ruminococcus sp.]
MAVQYEIFTNIGKRQVNEDNVCVAKKDDSYCFTLADGLGGHGKGEVASQMVAQSICGKFKNEEITEKFLKDAYVEAQEKLAWEKKQRHETTSMMTTAVSLVIRDNTAKWAHIGDSRLYLFRKNKVVLRTIDHSVPQMLVLSKELRERKIRNHPDRNKLTKAFGSTKRIIECTESKSMPLDSCQSFLLCSDGFWELIYEREMCRTLKKSKSVSEWVDQMVEIIVRRGKDRDMDNFSAIAVWIK